MRYNPDDPVIDYMTFPARIFFLIDYRELEGLIEGFYGIDEYSVVEKWEASNDTEHSLTIGTHTGDALDSIHNVSSWIEGKNRKEPSPQDFLEDLCALNAIPSGMYLVRISW